MQHYVYRLRSMKSLLAEHKELEEQEIYFAPPQELNDPMEGLADVFWLGDEIVWANLFRHYLRCLERTYSFITLMGETKPIEWTYIPVAHHGDPYFTPIHQALLEQVYSGFLSEPFVSSLVTELSNRSTPTTRQELLAYLQLLHPFAISVIRKTYKRRGLAAPNQKSFEASKFREYLSNLPDVLLGMQRLSKMQVGPEDGPERLFEAHNSIMKQINLLSRYNLLDAAGSVNRNFVVFDFCEQYVKRIDELVHPSWYTSCFMMDCRNAAAWGTYGDGHQGACLIFNVEAEADRMTLPLTTINGWDSQGARRGVVNFQFYPVEYQSRHTSVDFFRSLACQPIPTLSRYWYTSPEGKRSHCGDSVLADSDVWREKYWEEFHKRLTVKLVDWKHENETRLILRGGMVDYSDKATRALKYDFNSLAGIIFGIATSTRDKIEVCRSVEEKCRLTRRKDFKFFQAFFNRHTGKIDYAEYSLLKFK